MVPLFALLVPGALLAKFFGVQDQLPQRRLGCRIARDIRRAGCRGLGVAVGAGWYGYWKSTEKVDVESLDLSKGDTPRSAHVVITGVARTNTLSSFETKTAA